MKFSVAKKNRKYLIIAAVILFGIIGSAVSDDDTVDANETLSMNAESVVEQTAIVKAVVATDTATATPTDEPTATPSPSPTSEPTPVPETKIIYLKDNDSVEVSYDAKYCGSKRSEVFHYINCNSVGDIALKNFVVYESVEDAVAHGKRPCKRCEP